MLYRVVLTLNLLVNSKSVTIQVKATEQHFNAMLFIKLYKVVLTFESVDEILNCDTQIAKLLNSTLDETGAPNGEFR